LYLVLNCILSSEQGYCLFNVKSSFEEAKDEDEVMIKQCRSKAGLAYISCSHMQSSWLKQNPTLVPLPSPAMHAYRHDAAPRLTSQHKATYQDTKPLFHYPSYEPSHL
jgi:hypothetical protein